MDTEGYDKLPIFAGKLEDMEKTEAAKKKESKKKEQKSKLAGYFEDMDKKQNLTMTQAKLQRKLEENRGRRNIMKS